MYRQRIIPLNIPSRAVCAAVGFLLARESEFGNPPPLRHPARPQPGLWLHALPMRLRRDDPPSLHGREATEMVAGEPVRSGDGLSVDLETSGLNPPPSARSSILFWRGQQAQRRAKNLKRENFVGRLPPSRCRNVFRKALA